MSRRSVGVLLVAVLSLGAVVVSRAGEAKAKPKPKAASDVWPAPETVDPRGRPAGQLHDRPFRFYVFRSGDQWHVLSTSQSPKTLRFRGTIRVDQGTIKATVPVGKEKADHIVLAPSRREITFDLRTAKAADGFYFVVSPEVRQISFDLNPHGASHPRKHIFIGKDLVHPSRNPFVLRVEDNGAPAKAAAKTGRGRESL